MRTALLPAIAGTPGADVRQTPMKVMAACLFLGFLVSLIGVGPAAARAPMPPRPAVAHYDVSVGDVLLSVVRVDLRNPRISVMPVVAPNRKASFTQLLAHFRPAAAINGTFFDTGTWRITGNVVQKGRLVHEGYVGNAIAFTSDNRPVLVRNSGHLGRHTDWRHFRSAIGGGPTLLVGGRLQLDPWAEGFKDPGLFRRARRSAVGYTLGGTLFLVSVRTPVTFHELARIMLGMGVGNALSLDGGTSSALYCAGKVLSRPGRPLTNLLVVYDRRPLAKPTRLRQGAGQGRAY